MAVATDQAAATHHLNSPHMLDCCYCEYMYILCCHSLHSTYLRLCIARQWCRATPHCFYSSLLLAVTHSTKLLIVFFSHLCKQNPMIHLPTRTCTLYSSACSSLLLLKCISAQAIPALCCYTRCQPSSKDAAGYLLLEHALLDVSNCLARVQVLRACLTAVHDCVTPV